MGRRSRLSPIEMGILRCGCRRFRAESRRRWWRAKRKYLKPMGRISLRVVDARGNPVAARVFVTGADGLAYAPDNAWMYADDSFDRAERPFEAHYFDTSGASEIKVPAGDVEVDVMRGFENHFEQQKVEVKADSTAQLTVRLAPLVHRSGCHVELGKRRCSRAHELCRDVPEYSCASGGAGGG